MYQSSLKPEYLIKGSEYRILRVLGQGGFGITYEAEQVSLGRKVAIKEFFMKDLCNRDDATSQVSVPSVGSKELVEKFRKKFIREAKMIAGFDNEHIVRIYDVFEENGTAYYVMEYLSGGSLSDIVKAKGALSETAAIDYIRQIADALNYLHEQNTLHLDVKPSNVLLNKAGGLKLIDFGISKHYDEAGTQTSSTPIGISKGYAPLEQYQQGGDVSKFTPATDIYALGATFYYLLTGVVPPDASELMEDGLPDIPGVSECIATAIEKAMSPRKKDRPKIIGEFLSILESQSINKGGDIVPAKKNTPNSDEEMTVLEGTHAYPQPTPKSTLEVPVHNSLKGSFADHEWVDLGLPSGLKWATCNVGASNPEDYGSYFAWGEISPKSRYCWDTYKWCKGTETSFSKYNTLSEKGTTDFMMRMEMSDDAARQNWGSAWRMPTEQDFEELLSYCEGEWINQNGHLGYKFTSKRNGESIFLPAAGWHGINNCSDANCKGYYWTSHLNVDNTAYARYNHICIHGSYMGNSSRFYGQCIRPVTE